MNIHVYIYINKMCILFFSMFGSLKRKRGPLAAGSKICADRESNPGLKLGRLSSYRWTISASTPVSFLVARTPRFPWSSNEM